MKGIFARVFALVFLARAANIVGADNPGNREIDHPGSVIVGTTYADLTPLFAQQLEWWENGDAENKQILRCGGAKCATWEIKIDAASARQVDVVALVTNRDASCAVWYTGRHEFTDRANFETHISISLKRGSTVCK